MRLISGGSLLSLAGIRTERDNIIRPLIDVPRTEIEDYLRALGLTASHDSTNDSLDYRRNRIRRLLVPSLGSQLKDSLVSIALNIQTAEKGSGSVAVHEEAGYCHLSRGSLLSALPFALLSALYSIYGRFSDRLLSHGLTERMIDCAANGRTLSERAFIMTSSGDELRFYRPRVTFTCRFAEGAKCCLMSSPLPAVPMPSSFRTGMASGPFSFRPSAGLTELTTASASMTGGRGRAMTWRQVMSASEGALDSICACWE